MRHFEKTPLDHHPDVDGFVDFWTRSVEDISLVESLDVEEGKWMALENEFYRFEICITDDEALEISALKVFNEGSGYARKIIDSFVNYADENNLQLRAVDVDNDKFGFWTKHGFEPGSDESVWYHNG